MTGSSLALTKLFEAIPKHPLNNTRWLLTAVNVHYDNVRVTWGGRQPAAIRNDMMRPPRIFCENGDTYSKLRRHRTILRCDVVERMVAAERISWPVCSMLCPRMLSSLIIPQITDFFGMPPYQPTLLSTNLQLCHFSFNRTRPNSYTIQIPSERGEGKYVLVFYNH